MLTIPDSTEVGSDYVIVTCELTEAGVGPSIEIDVHSYELSYTGVANMHEYIVEEP